MKRILIILFSVFSLSGLSQNFFWSHTAEKFCFGYLYNWYVVDDAGGDTLTSSNDWSVPLRSQWESLNTYLGVGAGGKMKRTGTVYWLTPNTGATNSYGFNALGAAFRGTSGGFANLLIQSYFWHSDFSATPARSLLSYSNADFSVTGFAANSTKLGFSIRLVKDATGLSDGVTTTYTGNDGKIYNAIVIDEIYWTTENLEETEYRNGDTIPNVTDNTEWSNLTTGAWCTYNNNETYKCK